MQRKSWFPFMDIISRAKIRKQLYAIYIIAICVPISILGGFLLFNTSGLLTNYYQDLLSSDNVRVKTILFEITTQMYNISEEICFEETLQQILNANQTTEGDVYTYNTISNYISSHAEIDDIIIYTDNPYTSSYNGFEVPNDEIMQSDWYEQASHQSSVFWVPIEKQDSYGNSYWNLCLVRKIPVIGQKQSAILVIQVSDNYLQTRIRSNEYRIELVSEKKQIFYNSVRENYGMETSISIDFEDDHFSYLGPIWEEEAKLYTSISTLKLYQSESRIYIITMNEDAYIDIRNIIMTCLLILVVALVLPAMLIHYFTRYFTGRVELLRDEMNKASNEDYDIIPAFRGEDELSEAYADLQIMVQKIKDKDAKVYQSMLNEQQLENEQQVMEMKMLASQINPHFLYNTLESIRMQALTEGNRQVANSIRLLGKSMRYVLENTGTTSITLKQEFDYIETYLMIQKIRFRNRVNYTLIIEDDIKLEQYRILPLLLQPIVENAILHGLEEVEENGQIEIKVSFFQEEFLEIRIKDNGQGMSTEEVEKLQLFEQKDEIKKEDSIGLSNINRRIRLCYGKKYGIRIQSTLGEGTQVLLQLPIEHIL